MRQSKAQIYRRGLAREDVLKEPLTVYFSSMVAFGQNKRDNKQELLLQYEPGQIQSQAAILSNMLIYNYEAYKTKCKGLSTSQDEDAVRQAAAGEIKVEMPSLANIEQDEQHGLVAELAGVIKKCPEAAQLRVRGTSADTLLPRTTYEFEQGEKLSKIKAIRGLTPKKDVKI